ncbi:MAG: ABC transporter permease [Infirmifilum sp.]|jgi:spermidine/putrescine transport system permease protein|uniref:ABC transporter permease n=1 Tax=Infirmifilum TaxID=2856573 RepID=UPI0023524376
MRKNPVFLIAILPLLYVLTTFYVPIILMALESLKAGGIQVYTSVLTNKDFTSIILYSAAIAFITTLITLVLAFPAAYYLSFGVENPQTKNKFLVAFTVPMLINFLLRAYALMNILSLVNLTNTIQGMIIGMVYEFLPFMLLPIYSTLERIERRFLEAAETLGAKPWQAVLRITLPLATPGIASGVILVFLMAFTEFVVPGLLGGVYGYTVGYLIWDLFLKYRNWPVGSALAFIVTLTSIFAVYFYTRYGGGND